MKAVVLQALTERSMLKGTAKPDEMTELQFQFEMKKLEMQEREAERQERENRESMLSEKLKDRERKLKGRDSLS